MGCHQERIHIAGSRQIYPLTVTSRAGFRSVGCEPSLFTEYAVYTRANSLGYRDRRYDDFVCAVSQNRRKKTGSPTVRDRWNLRLGFLPAVKALLQSESCRGIITHVRST